MGILELLIVVVVSGLPLLVIGAVILLLVRIVQRQKELADQMARIEDKLDRQA
jgi:hypothetical protein